MLTLNTTADPLMGGNNTTIEDYDYEIVMILPLAELIPNSIAYGITLFLGIVGNGLVIFSVSRYQSMMTITNTFLLSLAIADLLLVLICVPVKFAAFFSFGWNFGEFLCKAVHYVQNVSAICSVTTLTMMSMERYYAIVHPMKAKYVATVGRARRAIMVLWVMSFILAIPILIGQIHMTVGKKQNASWCVKWFTLEGVRQAYDLYMFVIILVIPVHIMTFAYLKICSELWKMTKHRQELRSSADLRSTQYYGRNSNSNNSTPHRSTHDERSPVLRVQFTEDNSTKKQVIKMLVAIVVVFVICWAPILINNLLVAFKIWPELNIPPYKYMREAFNLMSYANSCVNPIVYGFMSRNFRQTFRHALCSCLRGRQYVRKLTFKKQNRAVKEKWNSATGTRHSELVSTTEILEMPEIRDKSTSEDQCVKL